MPVWTGRRAGHMSHHQGGRWRDVFSECGVPGVDIDYLGDILDSQEMLERRREAVDPLNVDL